MKRILTLAAMRKSITNMMVSAALLIAAIIPGNLIAQSDSAKAQEEAELISPSLEFVTVQKGDNTIDMKGLLQAKVNGANKKLPHLRITFFQVKGDEEINLGYAITNVAGRALFNCKGEKIVPDADGNINLKAVYAGNKAIESVEEELTIRKARLEIAALPKDSVLSVKVTLIDVATGSVSAVPEAALGVFVKRYWNPLKIAEATTDENGIATAIVPFELPGDQDGNIVLLVKLDEHELYGNMESGIKEKWGTTVSNKIKKLPRALWSSSPPIWMVVTFSILVTLVWGHYIVIIFELFRLRKEEPHST